MTRRGKRLREPTGGAVFVHDQGEAGVARLLTDLRPQEKPTRVYGHLADSFRDADQVVVFGYGVLRELVAELGSPLAVWEWVGRQAARIGRPVLCNVPDGQDTSVTVTIAPPDWSAERLKGYIAGRHQELERAYGPISHLEAP